ncbi:hypothetical protein [Phyllobacterium sp. 21LDTY02-6]|uniref:hypothetical protein n=1 Tax=Phyllobacterium sp. 21LDTY02-6 TaxID=2944903 RepID=UPI002020757F|nr:hypothetical protein [Phyllobacterium sp. 21LDTY02-6]
MRRRNRPSPKGKVTAEITIFPGVRYERLSAGKPNRSKPDLRNGFFDKLPQPS